MSSKTTAAPFSKAGRDTYLKLVTTFPLRSIRNLRELRKAHGVLDKLIGHEPLDDGEEEYLNALSDLVEHYEEHNVKLPSASDPDILRHLMEAHGLNQTQLADALSIPKSIVSELLSGKRLLARAHIDAIAKHFGISRDSFASR